MVTTDKDYVNLDVGHYLYTCHIVHLRRFPGTFLDRLVAPEHDTRSSGCDYIKIQRDGRLFDSIINYLIEPDMSALRGLSKNDLCELQGEADFYGLEELIQMCQDVLMDRSQSSSLEIIFGWDRLLKTFELVDEPTLVLNMDRFVELEFFESMDDVVTICALNNLPVIGYKANKSDQRDQDPYAESLMTLLDENLEVKNRLDVARFTRNEEFLKKLLKFIIAIMTLKTNVTPRGGTTSSVATTTTATTDRAVVGGPTTTPASSAQTQ